MTLAILCAAVLKTERKTRKPPLVNCLFVYFRPQVSIGCDGLSWGVQGPGSRV